MNTFFKWLQYHIQCRVNNSILHSWLFKCRERLAFLHHEYSISGSNAILLHKEIMSCSERAFWCVMPSSFILEGWHNNYNEYCLFILISNRRNLKLITTQVELPPLIQWSIQTWHSVLWLVTTPSYLTST